MTSEPGDLWCLWETMGDSDGKSRGRMRDAMVSARPAGWELVAALATVGTSGWWPHSMGLWRLDAGALVTALGNGFDDGVDEHAFQQGRSRLFERLHGELEPTHQAMLVESVQATTSDDLERLTDADLLLREVLTPWQGLAIWTAESLFALGERERAGVGAAAAAPPGALVDVLGWWAIRTPDRELV